MRKETHSDPTQALNGNEATVDTQCSGQSTLPNRLTTAFEVAEFGGWHEESVRGTDLRTQFKHQPFNVRSFRIQPAVQEWIAAPHRRESRRKLCAAVSRR